MAETTPEYLFVYGTLRRDSQNEMYKLLARHAKFKSEAWFNGKLFMVTYYPGTIASTNPLDKVYGEVYELVMPELILPRLDEYEECGENFPHPTEYLRVKRWVTLPDENKLLSWIYLYNQPVSGLSPIRSGDFYHQ